MSERPYAGFPATGIVRITHDVPIPGLGHVHTYLGESSDSGLILIDASLGIGDSIERVYSTIRFLGREPGDLEQVVLTHAHPDHVGLAKQLQQETGARVLAHPVARQNFERMQTPDHWVRVVDEYEKHGKSMEDERRQFFSFPIPDSIEDIGDKLDFAGRTFNVHHTPGHESGHVVFHHPDEDLLISGDALLGSITPHVGYYLEPSDPLGEFLESLMLIDSLDVSTALGGHGRVMPDGSTRAKAIRWHHTERLRQIHEIVTRDGPITALEVSRTLFGVLPGMSDRLAMSETLSHLEYLRIREQISRDFDGSVYTYIPNR